MQLRLTISVSILLAAGLAVPAIACVGLTRSEGAVPAQAKSARRLPQPSRPRPRSGPIAPARPLPSGLLPSGFLPSGFLPSGDLPSGDLPSGDLPSGEIPSGQFPSGGWSKGLANVLPGERPAKGMLQPQEWHAPILSPDAAADIGGYSVDVSPGERPAVQDPSEEPEIDTTYYEYRGFVPAW